MPQIGLPRYNPESDSGDGEEYTPPVIPMRPAPSVPSATGSVPPQPLPAPTSPNPGDYLPPVVSTTPIPTAPVYQSPYVPAVAQSWLKDHPWIMPIGGGVVGLLLGLMIGVAVGRRR